MTFDSQRLSAFFELENKLSGERNNSVDIVVSPSPEFALVDKHKCDASVIKAFRAEDVNLDQQRIFFLGTASFLKCRYGFDLAFKYRLQLRLAVQSYPNFWCSVLAIFYCKRTLQGTFA